MSTRRLVLPLKSVQWRALYTSNLAASLEFAGISHGLDAEAADSLPPDSGRLLLRCGGFDRWRSRREAETALGIGAFSDRKTLVRVLRQAVSAHVNPSFSELPVDRHFPR